MMDRMYTIETLFEMPSVLEDYLDTYVSEFNLIERYIWRERISPDFKKKYTKESELLTHVCTKFHIMKRTANSINFEVKGRIKALHKLKETEIAQLAVKIDNKSEQVENLKQKINDMKPNVMRHVCTDEELKTYRNNKKKLYWAQNKLNQLRQRKEKQEYQYCHHILKVGFGTKKMFRAQYNLKENGYRSHTGWVNTFRKKRDANIFYLGSKDESYGNQMFQMTWCPGSDDFKIRLRKELKYMKNSGDRYITAEHVNFRYMKEELKKLITKQKADQAVSYRFHRKNNRWYLQVMFSISYDHYATISDDGVIGLDFNKGFIEASETDHSGNLTAQYHYELRKHGEGNKAKSEMREVISEITEMAYNKGKDIAIENLDFRKKKAKNQGKGMNRMIHQLDYSRYKETMQNSCHKHRIHLHLVNPRNTSKIGKKKYCNRKKLTVHQAASYVIARRAQGHND